MLSNLMIFVIIRTWGFTDPTLLTSSLAVTELILDEEVEVCREEYETGICGIGILGITVRAKRDEIGG